MEVRINLKTHFMKVTFLVITISEIHYTQDVSKIPLKQNIFFGIRNQKFCHLQFGQTFTDKVFAHHYGTKKEV